MLHPSQNRTELQWAPLTRDDLPELSTLLTAIEHADTPGDRHSLAELYSSYEATGTDAASACQLARDPDGLLVAYGWNSPYPADAGPRRVHVRGGVHPDRRGRGIGRALLDRQLVEARRWWRQTRVQGSGPLQVVGYVDEGLAAQRALYQRVGLRPVRWYADLTLRFADGPPEHVVPPGIRIVPMNRKRLEAVRAAHNEAFADHWGTSPVDAVRWEEQLTRADSRLSWSWVALAEETSEVVGYVTNAATDPDWQDGDAQDGDSRDGDGHEQDVREGWTDRLGVRPAWRGRGIARALLTASGRSFRDAGLAAAGLGVDFDDPARARKLYEELGYRSTATVVMYARTDDEGDSGGSRD